MQPLIVLVTICIAINVITKVSIVIMIIIHVEKYGMVTAKLSLPDLHENTGPKSVLNRNLQEAPHK